MSEGSVCLDVDVMFEGYEADGLVAFTTHAMSDTEYGLDIWRKAISGEYDPISPYEAPDPHLVITVLPSVVSG